MNDLQVECILLVEDNEDDVLLMQRALKAAGVQNPLYCVENGQAAMDYLAGLERFSDRIKYPLPAVVFLDLNLPRKSGYQVLQWARARPDLESVGIFVLTSSNEPADLRTSYQLGAKSYLVKPPTAE